MKPDSRQAEIGLIIIGDEILSGRRADKHLARVIELLTARSLELSWARYLRDDAGQITAVLREAFATPALVFSTGGIGATPDDLTRQCAAAALGLPLELHPEARRLIQDRIRRTARERGEEPDLERPDNLHRLNMGRFPAGARIVPNPYNGIPGFSCTGPGGGTIYFTPGFPVMAWPMIEWVLDRGHGGDLHATDWCERSVIVYGIAESLLAPVMDRVQADHPDVKLFSLPSVDHPQYGAHIDLGVHGAPVAVEAAFASLLEGMAPLQPRYGPQSRRR